MALVRRLRLVVLVIAAASVGYLGARVLFAPPAPPPVVRATVMPQAIALPALSLVDQDGRPMTRDAFADRWTIVFFGFTACPDVCPTTLAMLAQVERQLRELPAAERPRVLLISVDPDRDDATRLRAYVKSFNADFLAATGTSQAISQTAQAFGIGYARIVRPDGSYTVEHGSSLFVVGPSRGVVATFPAPHDPRVLASDYRLIVEHERSRSRAFSLARLFARTP